MYLVKKTKANLGKYMDPMGKYLHTVSNGAAVNLHIFSCGFGRVGQVRKGENMATSKAAHHSTFYLLIFSILLPISNLSSSDRSKGGRS